MAFNIGKVIGFIELSNYEKPAEEVGNLSWSQSAQTYIKKVESGQPQFFYICSAKQDQDF